MYRASLGPPARMDRPTNAARARAARPIAIHMESFLTSGPPRPGKVAAAGRRGNSAFALAVALAAVVRRLYLSRQQLLAVLLVARQSLFDHADGGVGRPDLLHLHLLALQLLVVLEEA